MVAATIVLGTLGLVFGGAASRLLLRLHRMRRLSDVMGTVVARDRQFTGRGYWTYPVVEFMTRDGIQISRTFRQLVRPKLGRKLRIVYDPSQPDGRTRSTRTGLTLTSDGPVIYSVWLLLWLWLMTGAGLACFSGCIAITIATG